MIRSLVIGVLAVALVATAWFVSRTHSPSSVPAIAAEPARAIDTASPSPLASHPETSSPSDQSAPPSPRLPASSGGSPRALLAQVRAGDADALKELRTQQVKCEDSAVSLEEAAAKVELLRGIERETALRSEVELMGACHAFNDLSQGEKTEILLRVAETGDARALRQYVFETPNKLTGPFAAEEFHAYREAAQRLIDEAIGNRDSGAIAARGIAYHNGTAYRRDPIEAAANLQAYVRLDGKGALGVQTLLRQTLAGMSTEQRARVDARTDAILAAFRCSNCP